MANEKKSKGSKNKSLENKLVSPRSQSSSKMTPKSKVSKKPESPAITDEELSLSPPGSDDIHIAEDEDDIEINRSEHSDEEEDESVKDDEEDDLEEVKNGTAPEWPKNDDIELFKRIRKACPKEDSMKYDSRVNNLAASWDEIKFADYTADQCKERWSFVSTHLRHYRLLGELLDDATLWVDRPWYNFNKGGKKKNPDKHPDEPKKPLTSYMQFYMEQKDSVLEQHPKLGMTDLSKIIAKMYHELSEHKKKKYMDKAEKAKEVYVGKMKKFMETHPDYIPPKSKHTAKAVPPRMPTPFKLFCEAKMPGFLNDGISTSEARDRCRDEFKELNDKQRLKWIYKAVERENEFNEEMEKFKAEHPDVEISSKKQSLLTKEELQIKHKNEGKPDKPPNSGYSLFSKQMLSSSSLKQFETKERMSEISRLWKELGDEEKLVYNDKAHNMNHTYKMKYASYLETLTQEQRSAELTGSVPKGVKRSAEKKADEVAEKKLKVNPKAPISSSENSDEEDASDDDEFEVKKPAIQKPNSSLQMFCNTNIAKYSSKHPKLTKQELTRLMAKEFAKLSEDKKKIYGTMAQKSKNEMSSTSKQSPMPNTSKTTKLSKSAPVSKKANAKQVPTTTSNSPGNSKKSNNEKASKSSSKVKPSLNANAKSSPSKGSPKTAGKVRKVAVLPVWAEKQSLFNANEPPKPPKKPEEYYAMVHAKKSNLSSAEIGAMWGVLSDKQKKKHIDEHKKIEKAYIVDFENFVRNLGKAELKSFRTFMKNREQAPDAADAMDEDESSDEEENADSSNEEDQSASSNEDPSESSDDDE